MSNHINAISYISGLFDGGGNVYFRVIKSNRCLGYRIDPTITICLNDSDELYGFVDEFLMTEGIQYKLSETPSNNRRIEIDTRDNIEKFISIVRDKTVQHQKSLALIQDKLYPLVDSGEILSNNNFTKIVRTIEDIQPRRTCNNGVKYSTEFFKNKWNINTQIEKYNIEEERDCLEKDPEYIGGFFDGSGRIKPIITKSDSSNTGYCLTLRLSMTKSWVKDMTVDCMEDYLEDIGVEYNFNIQDSQTTIHLTDRQSVRDFLKHTSHTLIANFESVQMTLQKVLPAIEDEYHKTRQGIYDIIYLYESVTDIKNRKYTTDYFESEWDSIETDVISQNPSPKN